MRVKHNFSKQPTRICIKTMQRSAVLGTSRIVKNHLPEPGQRHCLIIQYVSHIREEIHNASLVMDNIADYRHD